MAGTGTKRIIELTEASTVQSGDYIAVDSNARGTKKVSTDTLATSAALTAETNARAGADEQMSERMDGIEEQTALIQNPTKTLSGALVSFTDGADMPMVACTASIVPKQSGSGTPSPSNVRAISGWESVSVYDAGKNLVDIADGTITTTSLSLASVTLQSGQYTLSVYLYREDGEQARVAIADSGGTIIATGNIVSGTSPTISAVTFTLATAQEVRIGVQFLSSYDTVHYTKFQLELGTTATAYEPYTGTTTTTPLGRTVYGGTLDVVSGVLTSYPFYPSYNGETLNGRWICDRAVYAEGTTPPTGSQVALISGTGTTYTLTGQEISTLLGENTIWADAGDVEITYRRDISIVLENLENALNGSNSLNTMMMSAPTENTAEEPTEDEAEDDMR